jgi:hypothetical protein
MSDESLVDLNQLTDARAALICARLQFRAGKRYLQKNLTSKGVATLYDSVLFGMQYYLAKHHAFLRKNIELWDAAGMFQALAWIGLFEDSLTFNHFTLVVERALWQGLFSSDAEVILAQAEELLTKLDVIPVHKKAVLNNAAMSKVTFMERR